MMNFDLIMVKSFVCVGFNWSTLFCIVNFYFFRGHFVWTDVIVRDT